MKQNRQVEMDDDLRKVGQALERAAQTARRLGFQTGTPVYVIRGDEIVNLTAEQIVFESRKPTRL
jgi:protein-disulfide isomerase